MCVNQASYILILLKSVIHLLPSPQEVGGVVVPTLDEEIYDKHLLLMMSCVLELPAKNFPISSKRSRVVTLEFYGGVYKILQQF